MIRSPSRHVVLGRTCLAWAAACLLAATGCEGEAGGAADAGSDSAGSTDAAAGDTSDTAADAAVDAAPVATELKWAAYTPPAGVKLRAAAAVPGQPGAYVVVGDEARVFRLDGTALTDISPSGVGSASLRGVYVAPDGSVFAAGTGSTLLAHRQQGWELAGEVPPTPPVQFTAISGSGPQHVLAVGAEGAAWRYDGGTWLPEVISPTDAQGGAALGPGAAFTCIHVRAADDVWLGAAPGATTPGVALHGQGGQWTAYPLAEAPRSIWASAPVASLGGQSRVFVAGGTASAYVAVREADSFVKQDKVLWQLGFTGVAGVPDGPVWATALKGQLRKWQDGAWSLDDIKSPPGTKPSELVQTGGIDLLGLAVHGPDERLVVAESKLFRYGPQPK